MRSSFDLCSRAWSRSRLGGWRLPPRGAPDVARLAARRVARGAGQAGFGNARAMRGLFEGALDNANARMVAAKASGIKCANDVLTKADVLGEALDPDRSATLKELNALPSLEKVKERVALSPPDPFISPPYFLK